MFLSPLHGPVKSLAFGGSFLLGRPFSNSLCVEFSASGIAAGLATASAERVVAGGKSIEVARVRITEAGRRALKGTGR